MIRPTGVQLVASRTGEHHVTGTVADVAFRDRGYEHAIDIPGHGRLTSVFSDIRADRGAHVGLRLDPRGCHLFSAAPAAPARRSPPASSQRGLPPRLQRRLPRGRRPSLSRGVRRDLRHSCRSSSPDPARRVIVLPGQGLASEP
jgi:hypothetical protein